MGDTIHGVERYAGVSVDTSDAGTDNVHGKPQSMFASCPNTSGATVDAALTCPQKGTLKFCYVQGSVTSDGTKTYTVTVTNVSNSSAAMLGTTVYDDDPVLTAGTRASATLSSTAANLEVDEGDLLVVSVAGGTGSGDAAVELVFEFDA